MNDVITRLKNLVDTRLNDWLCEMKEGYDDSMTGFNEAWDIVRKVFAEEMAEDDEGGVDPTTADHLKPRGNNGIVSAEIAFDALLLVGDTDIDEDTISNWTQEQRDIAYDWAMRIHLHASDNDDVPVPPRPEFISWQVSGAPASKHKM